VTIEGFQVSRSPDESAVHLVFEGDLDVESAPVLLQYLQDATSPGFRVDICLDVSGLSFIDSAGLSILVLMQKRARASGTTFTLSSPSERLLEVLDVAGLREFFDLVSS
jgi:anti-sigma B factor antagonist